MSIREFGGADGAGGFGLSGALYAVSTEGMAAGLQSYHVTEDLQTYWAPDDAVQLHDTHFTLEHRSHFGWDDFGTLIFITSFLRKNIHK